MSFTPRSASLESVASSLLSSPTDLHNSMASSYPETGRSASIPRRHERYYFSDGNVIFAVEGVLYNIHRYFFQRDSSTFASMLSLPFGGRGQGLMDDQPIPLPGVKVHDFDLLLSIFYPAEFGLFTATTVDEWTAILDLAAKWNFKSIKVLAIKQLAPIASPIDKVICGRKHQINEWLGDAYLSICVRPHPLTHEEGMRLGMDDVIKISAIRHKHNLGIKRFPRLPLDEELQKCFALDHKPCSLIHDARKSEAEDSDETRAKEPIEFLPNEEAPVEDTICLLHIQAEDPDETQPQESIEFLPSEEISAENTIHLHRIQTESGVPGEDATYEPKIRPKEAVCEPDEPVPPLTKAQVKKRLQQRAKEAKEKADREFQEQLEKELGANYFF